jgi:hypothetical protein
MLGRDGGDVVLKNYAGEIYRYPDLCGPANATVGQEQNEREDNPGKE